MINLVEINQNCNLSCKHCCIEEPTNDRLDFSFIEKIYPLLLRNKIDGESLQITGGEPTLNPDFLEIVKFLQHDFPLNIYTNGVFAEHNILRKKDIEGLSGRELADKFHEKLELICEDVVGLPQNVHLLKYLRKNKYTSFRIIKNMGMDNFLNFVNSHLAARNFIQWAEKIGFNEGTKFSIGYDIFHQDERDRLGYVRFPLLAPGIQPFIEKRLGVEISTSQGDYVRFVGRYRNQKNFSQQIYGRERLLKIMYEKNWSSLGNQGKTKRGKRVLSNLVGASVVCLDGHMSVKTDKNLHACSWGIIPPVFEFRNNQYRKNEEFNNVFYAYKNDGGPLGIGRLYGLSEGEVYNVLMDKGPCGICLEAMKRR